MKVSIVIPCLNEEAYIEKCVLSVLRSDYDMSNVEVFVCDGLSDDGTRTIVQELEKKHKNVHLLINEHRTTPYALNLGLKRGTGAIKFILGAHAEVDQGYISNSVQVLHDKPEVGCVGGIIDNLYSNEVARSIGIAMASRFGVGGSKFRTGAKDGYVDTVGFGAYRQEVFDKVGYFDEELTRNQDDEFNYRVNQAGYKIFLSNNVKSIYYVRASFKKLFRQYFQYGYWKVLVNRKHASLTSTRQLAPAAFVLFLLFGWLFSFFHPLAMIGYFTLIGIYLVVGIGSAMILRKKVKATVYVFTAFLVLHLSYGLGYLKGIFHFLILRRSAPKKDTALSR